MKSTIIFLNNVHISPAIVQSAATYCNASTIVGDSALASLGFFNYKRANSYIMGGVCNETYTFFKLRKSFLLLMWEGLKKTNMESFCFCAKS